MGLSLNEPPNTERHAVQPSPDEQRPALEERDLAEAAALAESVTRGPWITDEVSDGGGVIIASLPGGRFIVTTALNLGAQLSEAEVEANAHFICHARHLIDRLVQHVRNAAEEKEQLLARIAELKAAAKPKRPR